MSSDKAVKKAVSSSMKKSVVIITRMLYPLTEVSKTVSVNLKQAPHSNTFSITHIPRQVRALFVIHEKNTPFTMYLLCTDTCRNAAIPHVNMAENHKRIRMQHYLPRMHTGTPT